MLICLPFGNYMYLQHEERLFLEKVWNGNFLMLQKQDVSDCNSKLHDKCKLQHRCSQTVPMVAWLFDTQSLWAWCNKQYWGWRCHHSIASIISMINVAITEWHRLTTRWEVTWYMALCLPTHCVLWQFLLKVILWCNWWWRENVFTCKLDTILYKITQCNLQTSNIHAVVTIWDFAHVCKLYLPNHIFFKPKIWRQSKRSTTFDWTLV